MKERSLKQRLISAVLALVMMVGALVGTTFAWFTDSVSSAGNKIISGSLKVDLELLDKESGEWISLKDSQDPIFNYTKWEPGYIDAKVLKVENEDSLALKWKAMFVAEEELSILADVIDVYVKAYGVLADDSTVAYPADRALEGYTKVGTLKEFVNTIQQTTYGNLLAGQAAYLGIALKMQEEAGNDYQDKKLGEFDIQIVATQLTSESDSFGDDYDEGAEFPEMKDYDVVVEVPVENGAVSETTTEGNVTVPAGVKVNTNKLGATVKEMAASGSNVTLGQNEIMRPVDVHVDGVAADNTVALIVALGEVMPKGLNIGNYTLYHVENGVSNVMRAESALAALDEHNEFYYDPATGEVWVAMAQFSEVAMIADTENAWEGNFDYEWYDASKTELTIANADQLAAFGAIVGGMAEGIEQDSFSDKTVKLIADINLGDKESENNPDLIFYPIGYWNDEGTYEKSNKAISSGFYNFCGTFDGNGNTIANFYQNTWEMKGDNEYYDRTLQYYRDGMGLFGRLYKATIKNLTVKNFSSDGEYTTTGTIAAYAEGTTFENIAIFNCNPRVYNIGNGGIVGCVGWYAKEANLKTTFKNITVDNSNKISALWGSWDVACGGILGQYYPTSGQTSAGKPANGGIHFENCHVAAQIDVYNDVCANYQYYAYRYAGILIGSVRENVTIDGHSYPKMDDITAENCTVHFGDWNDYYYCELVANSLASYTHDHQMSRLEQVAKVDVENMQIVTLKGETKDIPTSGRVNYVVVKAKNDKGMWIHGDGHEYAECYHFVNGVQHFHDVADADNPEIYETVNGNNVLKEDKQLVYREFNNLVTGYGWGVTSKGVGELVGVDILDKTMDGSSAVKFAGLVNKLENGITYKLGDIFKSVYNGIKIVPDAVSVGVTNVDANGTVIAEFVRNDSDWTQSTITFSGSGNVNITITDYYFCTPTTIAVEIVAHEHVYENACDTTCNTCGAIREITHTYTSVVTAPTCTTGGYTTYTCSCGDTYKADEIAALGHTEVIDAAVDATCTTTGLTEGKHCSVCNEVFVAQETVAAKGHTAGADATCTTAQTCTVCGVELESKLGHVAGSSVVENNVAPDCVNKGSYDNVVYCTVCNAEISRETVTVDALEHKYETAVTAPTCTTEGYTTYTCHCGDSYVADKVAALSHNYNNGIVTTQPTCEGKGVKTFTCANDASHTYTEEVAAKGHTEVVDKAVAATCTTDGKTEGKHCSVCNKVLVAQTVVEKLGHTPSANATCTTAQICTVCKVELVAAAGHQYESKVTSPTCGAEGYTTSTCKNCGVSYDGDKTAALGHAFDFETKFNGDFLYRVGNQNTVALSALYDVHNYNNIKVVITSETNGVSGTYSDKEIQFTGTGLVMVKVTDTVCGTFKTLYLEVVDAVNATGAISATKDTNVSNRVENNVVLLNDISASSIKISDGYTFCGNGFKVEFSGSGDYRSASVSYGFVTIENGGVLDNTQIICKIFPQAYMFAKEMTAGSDGRYPYGYSAVIISGNSVISNSYIYGARNNIQVGNGNVTIQNTVTECGSLSNIHIMSEDGNNVVLDNVTTIQRPVTDDFGVGNTMLGFGILVGTNETTSYPAIKITGDLRQYNWVSKADANKVSSTYAKQAINGAITDANYVHTFDDVSKINFGIVFLTNKKANIQDNRIDSVKTQAPYLLSPVSMSGYNGQVYSVKAGSQITSNSRYSAETDGVTPYVPNSQRVIAPQVAHSGINGSSLTINTAYNNAWVTTFTADLDNLTGGSYSFAFNDLVIKKYGKELTYTVKDSSGKTVDKSTVIALNQLYTGEYTLIVIDNAIYNSNGELSGETVTHEMPFVLYATKTSIAPPEFKGIGSGVDDAIRLVSSSGGNWRPAYPALKGVSVTYWSASEGKMKTVELETLTNSGKISGQTWTYTCDDFTLKITGGPVHTTTSYVLSPMKATRDEEDILYFAAANKDNSTGTTARLICLEYVFTDKNASTTVGQCTTYSNGIATVQYANLPEFSWSSFQNGKVEAVSSGGGGSCVTSDTLVTLADGTQKRVDELTYADQLLVWDFYQGKYVAVPAALIVNHGYDNWTVIELVFDDGTVVKTISAHAFFDADTNAWELLNANNAQEYIGHAFVKMDGDSYETVTLVDINIYEQYTESYSLVSAYHYNFVTEGMFSLTNSVYGMIVGMEVGENMTYDQEILQNDIDQYGMYTYEYFEDYITYEQYVAFNGDYLKISVEKGYITFEGILALIDEYLK